jgi:hypothetical protein
MNYELEIRYKNPIGLNDSKQIDDTTFLNLDLNTI